MRQPKKWVEKCACMNNLERICAETRAFSMFCFAICPKSSTFAADMNRFEQPKERCRWRRFSHKAYAAFRSLHREVSIGVLGVAMLGSCAFVRPPGQIQEPLQRGECADAEQQGNEGDSECVYSLHGVFECAILFYI